jgi:hypothetical protein
MEKILKISKVVDFNETYGEDQGRREKTVMTHECGCKAVFKGEITALEHKITSSLTCGVTNGTDLGAEAGAVLVKILTDMKSFLLAEVAVGRSCKKAVGEDDKWLIARLQSISRYLNFVYQHCSLGLWRAGGAWSRAQSWEDSADWWLMASVHVRCVEAYFNCSTIVSLAAATKRNTCNQRSLWFNVTTRHHAYLTDNTLVTYLGFHLVAQMEFASGRLQERAMHGPGLFPRETTEHWFAQSAQLLKVLAAGYRKEIQAARSLVTEETLTAEGRYIPYCVLRDAVNDEATAMLKSIVSQDVLSERERRDLRDATITVLEVNTLFGRQETVCGKLLVNMDPIGLKNRTTPAGASSDKKATIWAEKCQGTFEIFIASHKTSNSHGPIQAVTDPLTTSLLWQWLVKGRWTEGTAHSPAHVFNSARLPHARI